jgi:hypothetical protein
MMEKLSRLKLNQPREHEGVQDEEINEQQHAGQF